MEPKKSFCKVCCSGLRCSSLCKNIKSVFQRKPSNLEALDGLRAMAVMWVIIIHNATLPFMNTFFSICVWPAAPIASAFTKNGDMGVDIFFVLSGFLIAYILLKEI
jgi:peptidoglycan/LPS O-acetylase OafA/YrhL